jgi:hypothetical protein
MTTRPITLATLALFAVACVEQTTTSPIESNATAATQPTIAGPMFGAGNNGNGVVHQVSAGGHDADIALNDDANFSLVAVQYGDGSVSGQWTDQFGQGEGGFHAEVNCLLVVGNQAWISGTITSGGVPGTDFAGLPVITRVADLARSANDGPDAISFSFIGNPTPCTAAPNFVLLAMTDGQVSVK